jgi:hypothetical protein
VLFRILEYLVIGIFFLRYCTWKSYYVCVLGLYWYICVIWIAIFVFVILGHLIDSCHNTTFFFRLTGSNISLWCYFWKYFYLNLFRNMSSSSSQHNIWQMGPLENWLLLKSDVQIPKVSGLRWVFFPSSCRAFCSIPSNLYRLEISAVRGCQSADNQFQALQNQKIEGFSVHGSGLHELEAEVVQIYLFIRISLRYLILRDP